MYIRSTSMYTYPQRIQPDTDDQCWISHCSHNLLTFAAWPPSVCLSQSSSGYFSFILTDPFIWQENIQVSSVLRVADKLRIHSVFLQTGSEFHLGFSDAGYGVHVVSTSLGSPFSRSQVEGRWSLWSHLKQPAPPLSFLTLLPAGNTFLYSSARRIAPPASDIGMIHGPLIRRHCAIYEV